MASQTARVPTGNGSRYLQQLCKHWGHKLDVRLDGDTGVVRFPEAVATMAAGPEALAVTVEADDEATLERMKGWSPATWTASRSARPRCASSGRKAEAGPRRLHAPWLPVQRRVPGAGRALPAEGLVEGAGVRPGAKPCGTSPPGRTPAPPARRGAGAP